MGKINNRQAIESLPIKLKPLKCAKVRPNDDAAGTRIHIMHDTNAKNDAPLHNEAKVSTAYLLVTLCLVKFIMSSVKYLHFLETILCQV